MAPGRSGGGLSDYADNTGLAWAIVFLVLGGLLPVFVQERRMVGSGWGMAPRRVESTVRVTFPNFEVLGQKKAPGVVKFLALYPVLAGVAAILLVKLTRGYARALSLIGITAVLMIVALFALKEVRLVMMSAAAWAGVLDILALVGLFVGLRVQRERPLSQFGRLLAGICGSVYLLLLVLPLLPEAMGTIPLLVPFKLLEAKESAPVGGFQLVIMLALIAAAVMGCVTFAAHEERNRKLGAVGSRLLFGIAIAAPVAVCIALMWQSDLSGLALVLMPLTALLKVEGLVLAPLALLAVGLIEVYATASATPAGRRAEGRGARPAPGGAQDPVARLRQLKELADEGIISAAEYEAKKQQILAEL
jgi:hypothetical protein